MRKLILLLLCTIGLYTSAKIEIITNNPSGSCSDLNLNFSFKSHIVGTGFDFNSSSLPRGWDSSPYMVASNYCRAPYGFSKTRTPYFWATYTNWRGVRYVSTNELNVEFGGIVKFDMRYGRDDGQSWNRGRGCEDPDLPEEGVFLQYSTNGRDWHTIISWDPISGYGSRPGEAYLYAWNTYQYAIPNRAKTKHTRFRWYQPYNSGRYYDNWGLDDIQISIYKEPRSVHWDFGDGTTSTSKKPVHKYAVAGNYIVTLTVVDNYGVVHVETINYKILDNQPPVVDAIPDHYMLEDAHMTCIPVTGIADGDICINQSLTLKAYSNNTSIVGHPAVVYPPGSSNAQLCITPKPNQNGRVTITLEITDDGTGSTGGPKTTRRSFGLYVTPVNDRPTANQLTINLNQNESYTINKFSLVYFDIDMDAMKGVIIKNLPTKGTLTYKGRPVRKNVLYTDYDKLTYTPFYNESGRNYANLRFSVVDEHGLESLKSYKITAHVMNTNQPPKANDDMLFVYVNNSDTLNVIKNDTDFDNDRLVLFSYTSAANGVCNINPDGLLTYTPNKGFVGTETIDYRVTDGKTSSNYATIYIQVDTARWNGTGLFTQPTLWNGSKVPRNNDHIIIESGTMTVHEHATVNSVFVNSSAKLRTDSFTDFNIQGDYVNRGGVMRAEEDSKIIVKGHMYKYSRQAAKNGTLVEIKSEVEY